MKKALINGWNGQIEVNPCSCGATPYIEFLITSVEHSVTIGCPASCGTPKVNSSAAAVSIQSLERRCIFDWKRITGC